MKNYLISYILYLISCNLSAQNTSFSKLYTVIPGLPCEADRINVCPGGYVIYGATADSNNFYRVVMMKVDTLGNVVWKKSYGKSGYNYYDESIIISGGGGVSVPWGGYIEPGSFGSNNRPGWFNLALYRFDDNGDTIWTKIYNDSTNETGITAKVTRQKQYIIGGEWVVYDTVNQSYKFFTTTLKKTDSLGNTIWQRTYHTSHNRESLALDTCKDGGYIICADDNDANSCGWSIFIMKTDSAGTPQWTRYINGLICDVFPGNIISLKDGSYIVGGTYVDSERFNGTEVFTKLYLAKISSTGSVKWAKQYGYGSWITSGVQSLKELPNGDIIACGEDSAQVLGCILKVDSDGNQKWLRYYEMQSPAEQDNLFDIQSLPDGGFVAAGSTYGATENIWVVKVDSLGVVAGLPSLYRTANDRINVYPNPSNGQFIFDFNAPINGTIKIYDITGRNVYQQSVQSEKTEINIGNQPNGMYFYRALTNTGSLIGEGKLIIEK